MSMLLRKEGLSFGEWLNFLELVRKQLNPLMDKFTLDTFGDLACVHSEEGSIQYHRIKEDEPVCVGIGLDTHGIAYFSDTGRLSRVGDTRDQFAWGLTKKSQWVLVRVSIELVPSKMEDLTQELTRERAKGVCVDEVCLEDMLRSSNVSPHSVWRSVHLKVKEWEARSSHRARQVAEIAEGFKAIDNMLTGVAVASA